MDDLIHVIEFRCKIKNERNMIVQTSHELRIIQMVESLWSRKMFDKRFQKEIKSGVAKAKIGFY